jgi:peptide/nickel transport system substrate-binding protein
MRRLARREFLGVGMTGALVALAGPVRAQTTRKQLVYAKNEDIGQLNPYFVNHAVFESLANHIQEPLVRFDYERRTWEPVLAEGWTVEDRGKTWVFRVRDGVRFHDGTPLTAEDVKYSLDAVLNEKTAFCLKANVEFIEAIKVRDRMTVAVHAKEPLAGVLSYIQSRPSIMSRALGDKVGFDEAHKKMVGTGPYRFVEYARDERLVMERNPDYWGAKAKIDRIIYRPIPDATARMTALRAGQVDAVAQVPAFDIGKLEGVSDVRLHGVRAARINILFMNPIVPPLQQKLVRQAIHHGIDLDTIVKTVLEGRAHRLSQLVDFYDYAAYNEYKPMALAVSEQLRKVGVRRNVKSVESGVFRRMWFNSEMPMFFISYGNVAEDASAFLKTYFRSGADRRSQYKNPEVDALFDQQEVELDPKKRHALNRQLLRLLQDESPAIPLYNPQYTVAARRHVHIPPGQPTGGEFVWFWKMDVA